MEMEVDLRRGTESSDGARRLDADRARSSVSRRRPRSSWSDGRAGAESSVRRESNACAAEEEEDSAETTSGGVRAGGGAGGGGSRGGAAALCASGLMAMSHAKWAGWPPTALNDFECGDIGDIAGGAPFGAGGRSACLRKASTSAAVARCAASFARSQICAASMSARGQQTCSRGRKRVPKSAEGSNSDEEAKMAFAPKRKLNSSDLSTKSGKSRPSFLCKSNKSLWSE
mmetsp:Transcript_10743/g.35732  ORF Transcript_10743/g.35732 Transcript_10743/m.35732 type:complete len:229 (-) Transcript_10743:1088-1774(-)